MATSGTSDASTLNSKTFSAAHSKLRVVTQYCAERPYAELCIPSELEVIRRIVFKITSHDQGNDGVKPPLSVLIVLRFQR
jgi:hypothetical protein